ncbi:hypothetical protein QCM80_11080 [Bradyrhizobium sp. SSUT112]|uniref:hypothetical protein n=1 Tax=Bradyrhizobium sp. SSUT112 TaxID=3040604 RepID=UPI00244D0F98|nr:hypothetical protein [Bradyrhizobium sp. SSUT112]MDH2351209.1 hypothetical protein [Bradyrhizobium sp. SSUT112]
MKPRACVLVPALAVAWIVLGIPAKALEINGSWATSPSSCGQVFIKKEGAISFRQDSEQYGGGFILEGDKIRGQMQTCTINRRKEDGNVVHMIARCADDIMTSNIQFSAKIVDDNTIVRVFPGMPELTLSYSRCPM